MIGDQRVVCVACGVERHGGKVDPVDPGEPFGLQFREGRFQVSGPWIQDARGDEDPYRQDRRYPENRKGALLGPIEIEHAGNDERADHRSDLVHGLMETESQAPSHLTGRVGEHGITDRISDGPPHTFPR